MLGGYLTRAAVYSELLGWGRTRRECQGIAAVAVALFIVAIVVAQEGTTGCGGSRAWPGPSRLSPVGAPIGHDPAVEPLIAVVVGGLVFALIAGWVIVAAITGNL